MDLKGKVVLITGGALGIGRAYSFELLRHGAKVAVCDINIEAGEKLVQQLSEKYGKDKVIFCHCDVTDYPQYEESFQTTVSVFGGLDIVINNAGILNDRLWELEVDVNLNGVIRGTLLALRFLGKDRGGKGGIVVNTGSNVVIKPYISTPIYTATKHAIIGFTRSFGDPFHVNMTGVKVIGICPGPTESDLLSSDIKKQLLSSDYEKAWQKDTCKGSTQKAEHVAKSLIYLLQKAPSGSVWMVENSLPPREINFTTQ